MKHATFLRCMSLALALLLAAAALPFGALAAEAEIIELVATDVTLDETRFEHTGEEIRPNVTVRVKDRLLTLDRDYTLEYKNNVAVGTAAVVVTGIATSGYMGTVEHPFYIEPKTEDTPALITIKGTDVTIDGTSFPATGEEIKPGVTVTAEGKTLTAGEEYTLVYENNIQPGTASVTVTGVEAKGYTGTVIIHYTIEAAETQPEETKPEETKPEETKPEETKPEETKPEETKPEETKPEETKPEETKPEETKPEETKPEETKPEETKPDETQPVSYKITKGSGATWYKDSGKSLSFTADGNHKDFTAILVDGKKVNSSYYTVAEGTVVILKSPLLQSLALGKHTVTLRFQDGEAVGTFTVAVPTDHDNPKTGDDFALHTWTAILFVSLTGTIGTVFAFRKKIWK